MNFTTQGIWKFNHVAILSNSSFDPLNSPKTSSIYLFNIKPLSKRGWPELKIDFYRYSLHYPAFFTSLGINVIQLMNIIQTKDLEETRWFKISFFIHNVQYCAKLNKHKICAQMRHFNKGKQRYTKWRFVEMYEEFENMLIMWKV